MAANQSPQEVSVDAGEDLSAKQHHIVKLNSSGQAVVATAAGEKVFGVLTNDPNAAGKAATVAVAGIVKVVADGTIAAGNYISTSADGQARASTAAASGTGHVNTSDTGAATDALLGAYILGVALEAAAAGEKFAMLITHSGAVPTTAV